MPLQPLSGISESQLEGDGHYICESPFKLLRKVSWKYCTTVVNSIIEQLEILKLHYAEGRSTGEGKYNVMFQMTSRLYQEVFVAYASEQL